MSNITGEKNYDLFIQETRFFYCQDIFEGDWDGKEKYIVASDTPEDVLLVHYPEIMKKLSPYLFCNAACGEVYAESKKNIDKHKKRASTTTSYGSIEVFEKMITDGSQSTDMILIIEEMLSVCTPIQRDRIRKFYLEGMPIPEIANGRSIKAVYKSIRAGLIKIQKKYHVKVEK